MQTRALNEGVFDQRTFLALILTCVLKQIPQNLFAVTQGPCTSGQLHSRPSLQVPSTPCSPKRLAMMNSRSLSASARRHSVQQDSSRQNSMELSKLPGNQQQEHDSSAELSELPGNQQQQQGSSVEQ